MVLVDFPVSNNLLARNYLVFPLELIENATGRPPNARKFAQTPSFIELPSASNSLINHIFAPVGWLVSNALLVSRREVLDAGILSQLVSKEAHVRRNHRRRPHGSRCFLQLAWALPISSTVTPFGSSCLHHGIIRRPRHRLFHVGTGFALVPSKGGSAEPYFHDARHRAYHALGTPDRGSFFFDMMDADVGSRIQIWIGHDVKLSYSLAALFRQLVVIWLVVAEDTLGLTPAKFPLIFFFSIFLGVHLSNGEVCRKSDIFLWGFLRQDVLDFQLGLWLVLVQIEIPLDPIQPLHFTEMPRFKPIFLIDKFRAKPCEIWRNCHEI